MRMSANLSKSLYCSGVQCPKMLWMKKHRPELFDQSVLNQAVLDTGSDVGDLAMGLFGDYTEVPYGDLNGMIAETKRLLANGTGIIAEASFDADGLFCSVDILKNLGGGKVGLYEVKSSTSVHEIYLHDVAYQVYVLKKAGLDVVKACLVHINREYIRGETLEIDQLFTIEDLTEPVMQMQSETAERIGMLKALIRDEAEPSLRLGEHCFSPYDCGFWAHCSESLPEKNVFALSGMQLRTKCKYYDEGIVSFEDLEAKARLNAGQRMQICYELHDMEDHIETEEIRKFMKTLRYPLYFLDFESFAPAIPLYKDSKPYDQIVFQYSLHCIEDEGAPLRHREFLAMPGGDPRRSLAEQLCRDIPQGACILAYNMTFEKTRITELARLYPGLSAHLMDIVANMRDLMIPFRKKQYYSKEMHGSYSIKYVLPALFPGDPDLDYHNLTDVHNGSEASAAFAAMGKMQPDELSACRDNLLKYCCLDTYAMVKLWEKMRAVVAGAV